MDENNQLIVTFPLQDKIAKQIIRDLASNQTHDRKEVNNSTSF